MAAEFNLDDFTRALHRAQDDFDCCSFPDWRVAESVEADLGRALRILEAMTDEELTMPEAIGRERISRIAATSVTTPDEVHELLRQFYQMRDLLRRVGTGRQ